MKRYLVIGLFLLTILSLTACKKEEPEATTSPNYAVNETKDTTDEEDEYYEDEEVISDNNITTAEPEEEPEEIVIQPAKDNIYNVSQDQYAADIQNMSTISIDGKLIGFPCNYNYVVEKFGTLYTVDYNGRIGDSYIPVDETTTATEYKVYAFPETGEGMIQFTFKSDTPVLITEMTCNDITVQGGNTTGEKVMTFALPQYITFGSTFDEIVNVFGTEYITHYESTNNASDFRLRFVYEDLNQCYEFTGYDNGLYFAKINYNYTE